MADTDTSRNVRTHTGKVHAPRTISGNRVIPACMGNSAALGGSGIHYALPTDRPITCRKPACTGAGPRVKATDTPEVKAVKKAAEAARRAAVDAELTARQRDNLVRRIARLEEAEGRNHGATLVALRADLAECRADLAALDA